MFSRSARELEDISSCRKPPLGALLHPGAPGRASSAANISSLREKPASSSSSSSTSYNIASLREKLAGVRSERGSGHLASPVTPRRRFLLR